MTSNPELIAVKVEYFELDDNSERLIEYNKIVYVNFLPRTGDLVTLYINDKEIKRRVNIVEFFLADNRDAYPDITIRLHRR